MSGAESDDLVGEVLLGKLEVVRLLGAGGMGAVYEVVHRITRHHRALKVLHADFAQDAEVVARFLREASVAGTLNSPHVVETFDAGQLEDGSPYVLMEMLEGETLADLLEGRRVAPGRIAQLIHAAAEGLAAAHDAGIVHRDIKPENLFVTRGTDGEAKLKILDFGISKFARPEDEHAPRLTQTGRVLGTPLYMSPEQASGDASLDARTDVYSLGVILYEALAGRPPFVAETLPALVIQIHTGDCPPIDDLATHAPPALREVVRRAMARDRDERYADGRTLAAALEPFVAVDAEASVGLARTMASIPPRASMGTQPTLARDEGASTGPLRADGSEGPTADPALASPSAAGAASTSAAGAASPSAACATSTPGDGPAPGASTTSEGASGAAVGDEAGASGAGGGSTADGSGGDSAADGGPSRGGRPRDPALAAETPRSTVVPARSSRLPMILGAAALVVVATGGAFFAFGGGDGPGDAEVGVEPEEPGSDGARDPGAVDPASRGASGEPVPRGVDVREPSSTAGGAVAEPTVAVEPGDGEGGRDDGPPAREASAGRETAEASAREAAREATEASAGTGRRTARSGPGRRTSGRTARDDGDDTSAGSAGGQPAIDRDNPFE
ncbi:MAG TPA: serine/threonine-protein kinase [Sandaracinaceae bacterium LLY-WYZ-13_1]|nr:serine/threonine-protein kinase [Sandaracinaceae bacterium LLY-WYZ-13_1]